MPNLGDLQVGDAQAVDGEQYVIAAVMHDTREDGSALTVITMQVANV